MAEAEGYIEREALIASLLGKSEEITQEQIRTLTEVLEDLPYRLTREEAVFRLPGYRRAGGQCHRRVVEPGRGGDKYRSCVAEPGGRAPDPSAAFGRGPGRYGAYQALFDPPQPADGAGSQGYGGGDGRRYRSRVARPGHRGKGGGLLKAGYPLSEEQIAAIRSVTSSEGRVAIIEGAAGSGKTTTLRPIADLYREHGQSIIATAVAWRTAVALGNDVDARPFCVDKLLRLAARGGIEINKDATIIVDEAGMLSTRQAHHILRLSERHGAKIVFAGDTQQQQPVEAGPGLRLIRDVVGSVRVDRIRRQKADLEDILTHIQGETPETARRLANAMAEEKRTRILTYYETMKGRLVFTPWQVAAAEALRDSDAASAIAAYHERGKVPYRV